MFLELHILQNFAPSNLNRDDTGAPKDCEFGGTRRARISSQCWKRAIRTEFREAQLVPAEALATRTKRLHEEAAKRLKDQHQRDEETAKRVVSRLLGAVGIRTEDNGKSQYLLYVGEREIAAIVALAHDYWDELAAIEQPSATPSDRRGAKQAGREAVRGEIASGVRAALDGGKAADLALFGRMIADLPEKNVDAASQVAHAISTHRVSMEFDFYTAVDDLRPEDTEGADMLGTVEFNSACFYRYANVDLDQLARNLGGDVELARQAIEAFVRASVTAVPSGKQNSMAAQNSPGMVLAVLRERGLWSLANAFLKPVRPKPTEDLLGISVDALDAHWGQLTNLYGTVGIRGTWLAALDEQQELTHLLPARQKNFEGMVRGVVEAASFSAP